MSSNYKNEIVTHYQKNPLLRSLCQAIPGISVADNYLITKLSNIEQERTEIFFNELNCSDGILTKDIIESNEFLHCFNITSKAFLRTYRDEKIKLFARLLKGYFLNYDYTKIDEIEESLMIIDVLSY